MWDGDVEDAYLNHLRMSRDMVPVRPDTCGNARSGLFLPPSLRPPKPTRVTRRKGRDIHKLPSPSLPGDLFLLMACPLHITVTFYSTTAIPECTRHAKRSLTEYKMAPRSHMFTVFRRKSLAEFNIVELRFLYLVVS
ncbi:hypothetical protein E2C01_008098 [Portunus trituberculatus]|uniref:Uncharacterized protein n=1 Tax=Portunus trituberculatus TaxID=210409 RepID=A0A5B7CZW6_PORTR|nr:hypothetical protein [Portunus trituberculatus]